MHPDVCSSGAWVTFEAEENRIRGCPGDCCEHRPQAVPPPPPLGPPLPPRCQPRGPPSRTAQLRVACAPYGSAPRGKPWRRGRGAARSVALGLAGRECRCPGLGGQLSYVGYLQNGCKRGWRPAVPQGACFSLRTVALYRRPDPLVMQRARRVPLAHVGPDRDGPGLKRATVQCSDTHTHLPFAPHLPPCVLTFCRSRMTC